MVLVGVATALGIICGNAEADFTFGKPTNLGPTVNSQKHEDTPFISTDGLSLYFFSFRQGGDYGGGDIWVSTRQTRDSEWEPPENMGPTINTSAQEFHPSLSTDGLEFYFARWEEASADSAIWVSTRVTTADPWAEPVKLDLTEESTDEWDPSLTADGLQLYFGYNVPGDEVPQLRELCVTTRETKDSPWGPAVSLGAAVNGWGYQVDPRIAGDGRLLLFADYWNAPNRPGGIGEEDMWLSMRVTPDADWSEPANLGSTVNTVRTEVAPMISADGSTLYFGSNRYGGSQWGDYDLWQAPILPVVDLDGDGTVGTSDLVIMIERWGTDESLCDIGPMPWGDGVVDDADLAAFMGFWGQEIPTALIAHWTLDESEGMIAYDSAGDHDAILLGDPVWRPATGQVYGALELDGVDDGAESDFVLDPARTPFSVFAWIKGGAPGQVIVSQVYGADWLATDPSGYLMTRLRFMGDGSLVSRTNVHDGNWHHVGFVWDGNTKARILYVDHIEVARDTMEERFMMSEDGGVRIGAPQFPTHTNFWSGMIDDVQIYDRVVEPYMVQVQNHVVVDDFESYAGHLVWETWLDAFANNTGALIGYIQPPHVEVNIVHSGRQALAYFYENDGTVLDGTEYETKGTEFYAETERLWQTPQDWTVMGVEVLTLWFRGDPDDAAGRQTPQALYVALEDESGRSAVIVHPDSRATAAESWQQWSINLADFVGVDVKTIVKMTIGVGDPAATAPRGSGVLYIDDIELHRSTGQ